MQVDRIEKAIHSGEILQVRYFGGSSPGSERSIRPLSVSADTVRAHCLKSGETKAFKLVKLEEVFDGVPSELAKTFVPSSTDTVTHETVAGFALSVRAEVEALGWHVEAEDESFTLHRKFKSGKPMKGPDVRLTFEPIAFDLVFDGENVVEMNHRPRERPWVVAASKQNTKTFSSAAKAQATFLECAKLLAPGGAK
jgi:hypothetical protein